MVGKISLFAPIGIPNMQSRIPFYEGLRTPDLNPTPPLQTPHFHMHACRLHEDCTHCPYNTPGSPFSCNVPRLSSKTQHLFPYDLLTKHYQLQGPLNRLHTIT